MFKPFQIFDYIINYFTNYALNARKPDSHIIAW